MRSGANPAKQSELLPPYGHHRVVIPVHIPSNEGYFAQSRSVLARCLDSLRRSAEGKVAVTLVSDGSCPEVTDDLRARQDEGWVDQVVIHRPNRGKVDALVGAARGSYEELVTLADADVLFRPGWVEAIESLFAAFPECGAASPFPSPPTLFSLTSATLIGGLGRRELRLASVVDEADLDRFAASIGNPDFFPPALRRVQLVMTRGDVTACVGAPHFVVTLRRAVIQGIPPEPSRRSLLDSEVRWLDEPADRLGYWRLSTSRAFAQHMGNVPEPWMDDELASGDEPILSMAGPARPGHGRVGLVERLPWRLRQSIVSRVLRKRIERRIEKAAAPMS